MKAMTKASNSRRREEAERSIRERVQENLRRIKPLDVWVAEQPRSAADIALYHFVKDGFERLLSWVTRQ